MNDIKEIVENCTETDIFDEAVSKHSDVSAVECICLHPSQISFNTWGETFQRICAKARNKWQGIHKISIYYRDLKPGDAGYDSFAAVAVSGDSISLNTAVLNFITGCVEQLKSGDYIIEDLNESEDEEYDDEEIVAPPELVQIKVNHAEVQNWIRSFIQGKQNQINKQNIKDFCVEESQRQNCARVDAVLVKRKGRSGHIKVQNIENYWCQEVKKFPHLSKVPIKEADRLQMERVADHHSQEFGSLVTSEHTIKKKKVFSTEELNHKLAEFEYKLKNPKTGINIFQSNFTH